MYVAFSCSYKVFVSRKLLWFFELCGVHFRVTCKVQIIFCLLSFPFYRLRVLDAIIKCIQYVRCRGDILSITKREKKKWKNRETFLKRVKSWFELFSFKNFWRIPIFLSWTDNFWHCKWRTFDIVSLIVMSLSLALDL